MTKPNTRQKSENDIAKWALSQGNRLWRSTTQRVMSITSVGMLAALAVDVLLAARLGTTVAADALVIALSLPRLVDTVAREGTKFSLLALFVEWQERFSPEKYLDLVSGLLNLLLVIGLGCTMLGWLLAPMVISLLGPGLASEGHSQAVQLLRLSIPLTLFALGSTVLGVLLNSQQHFVVVSTRNGVVTAFVVLAIGLAWRSPQFSAWVAGAYTLGYALFFGLLLWYTTRRTGFALNWRAWPDRNALRQLRQATIYPTAGFGVRQGARMVERALASLVASGGVSTYYFAFRLISSVQSIVGVSVATTGLPRITQYDLNGDTKKFGKSLLRQIGRVVLVSLPVALGILVFHNQITSLLYGRGAFSADSVEQTGQILQWLGLGVVLMCSIPVLNSSLYAQRRFSWVLYNMTFVTVVNILLAWWLSGYWGLVGIAVAAVVSAAVSVANLWILSRHGQKKHILNHERKRPEHPHRTSED